MQSTSAFCCMVHCLITFLSLYGCMCRMIKSINLPLHICFPVRQLEPLYFYLGVNGIELPLVHS
jgi:hypothetical protein